jgi:uncharacterized membrane protein
MSTSGDEHATHDSEASDNGVHVQASEERDSVVAGKDMNINAWNFNIQWPQEHIELREIYEGLSPESADRILSMVEREQNYEKQARRAQSLVRIIGLLAVTVITVTVIVSFILIWRGKPATTWFDVIGGFAFGAVAVAVAFYYAPRRDDETSADSHRTPDD